MIYFLEEKMATKSIRLDQDLVDKAVVMAKAYDRTPPKQVEHWAKIGRIMEENPDLSYELVKKILMARAEKDLGKMEAYHFG